jgi:hypothetical protein
MPLPLLDRFSRLLVGCFGSLVLLGPGSWPRSVDASQVLGRNSPSLGRLVEQGRHLLRVRTIFVRGIPQIGRLMAGSLGADHGRGGTAERGIEHSRGGITQGGTGRSWHSMYALAGSSADRHGGHSRADGGEVVIVNEHATGRGRRGDIR